VKNLENCPRGEHPPPALTRPCLWLRIAGNRWRCGRRLLVALTRRTIIGERVAEKFALALERLTRTAWVLHHADFLRQQPCHVEGDRKSTRLNSSHLVISYAVFCLKKKSHVHKRPPSVSLACHYGASSSTILS